MKEKSRSQEETRSQKNVTQGRVVITLPYFTLNKAICLLQDLLFILILFLYPLLQEEIEEPFGKTKNYE